MQTPFMRGFAWRVFPLQGFSRASTTIIGHSGALFSCRNGAITVAGARFYARMAGKSSTVRRDTTNQQIEQKEYQWQKERKPEKEYYDKPHVIIDNNSDGISTLLNQPALLIGRQVEMLNVLVGYEQANKYAITDATAAGNRVGFIAEDEQSFFRTIVRQILGTRRPFHATVLDDTGTPILRIDRPVKWFLNSEIHVSDMHGRAIGSVAQDWHLWRRRYDLFLNNEGSDGGQQFAIIDSPFLSWDFAVEGEDGGILAAVNRSFGGFAREIFTDTGVYAIHMDNINPARPLTLDERAVLLACAINVDIDYFSRHSQG
ncbi:hypothetical protein HK100_008421, partial [Physocladia obscura]